MKVAVIPSMPLRLSARLTVVGKGAVVTRGGGGGPRCCRGGPALLLGGAPPAGIGLSRGCCCGGGCRAALLAAGGPLVPAQALALGLEAGQLTGPGLGVHQ